MSNQNIEFVLDKDALYREESITDMKVGAIRCLIPVKLDGSNDDSRKTVFVGNAQLMSESGMIPLQAPLKADSLEEAMKVFPEAMKTALEAMVEQAKKMQAEQQRRQQQNDSRIIVPR